MWGSGLPGVGDLASANASGRVGVVVCVLGGGWRLLEFVNGERLKRRSGELVPRTVSSLEVDALRARAKAGVASIVSADSRRGKRPRARTPSPPPPSQTRPKRGGAQSARTRRSEPSFAHGEPSVGAVVRCRTSGKVGIVTDVKCSGWRDVRTLDGAMLRRRPTHLIFSQEEPREDGGRAPFRDDDDADADGDEVDDDELMCEEDDLEEEEEEDLEEEEDVDEGPRAGEVLAQVGCGGWRRALVSAARPARLSEDCESVLTLAFEDGSLSVEQWPPLAERALYRAENARVPSVLAPPPRALVGRTFSLAPRIFRKGNTHQPPPPPRASSPPPPRTVTVVGFLGHDSPRSARSANFLVRFGDKDEDDTSALLPVEKLRATLAASEEREARRTKPPHPSFAQQPYAFSLQPTLFSRKPNAEPAALQTPAQCDTVAQAKEPWQLATPDNSLQSHAGRV